MDGKVEVEGRLGGVAETSAGGAEVCAHARLCQPLRALLRLRVWARSNDASRDLGLMKLIVKLVEL